MSLTLLFKPAPREKVLELLRRYSEGGSFNKHRDGVGIASSAFYAALAHWPDLETTYRSIQKARADGMVHESYDISENAEIDPRRARVQSDIRMKIAGMYDRQRFGDRLALDVQTVDLTGALADARSRVARRPRDLNDVSDAQVIEPERLTEQGATDLKSVDRAPCAVPDLFDD